MKTWKFTCKNFSLTCPLEIFMKLKLSYHRWFRGEALIIDYVLNVFQKWQKTNFEQNSLLHVVYTQILFFITECLIWIALLFFFLTFLDKNQILIFSKYMQICNHCKKTEKKDNASICDILYFLVDGDIQVHSDRDLHCITVQCIL